MQNAKCNYDWTSPNCTDKLAGDKENSATCMVQILGNKRVWTCHYMFIRKIFHKKLLDKKNKHFNFLFHLFNSMSYPQYYLAQK